MKLVFFALCVAACTKPRAPKPVVEAASPAAIGCAPGFADCDLDHTCETDLTATHRIACTVCAEGYDDCDGRFTNGCETDLATSLGHCGACGAECTASAHARGASCLQGKCTFKCETAFDDLNGLARDGCEAERLAFGETNVTSMSIGDERILWLRSDAEGIRWVPFGGGTLSTLSAKTAMIAFFLGGDLYWAPSDAASVLWKVAPSGGTNVAALKLEGIRRAVVSADRTTVVFATSSGAIAAWRPGEKRTTVLAEDCANVSELATQSGHAVWSRGDEVGAVALAGGLKRTLARDVSKLAHIATSSNWVYYTHQDGLSRLPLLGGSSELFARQARIDAIAADEKHVYFCEGSDLVRVPHTRGTRQHVLALPSPCTHLRIERNKLLWFDAAGTLRRAPFPP